MASFAGPDGDSPVLQFIGKMGAKIYEYREIIEMEIHLILAALFPIYIGSHASLRCPPSASKKEKDDADDEDDEIEVEETPMEGLLPQDALVFPLTAAVVLAALYYIIKWMDDPALLNKILGYYFSTIGVFGTGKLFADSLNVVTTFFFPSVWASRGKTYRIDPVLSQQDITVGPASSEIVTPAVVTNPLAGMMSSIKFSKAVNAKLWSVRGLLKNHWIFRAHVHGLAGYKGKLKFNDVVGFFLGLAAVVVYNTNGKAWWLTNAMGFGFSYGALQLLSPTTFWTGTLLLCGLFVYDIVMVFYT